MIAGRLLFSALAAAAVEPCLAQGKPAEPISHQVMAGEPGPDGWIRARSLKGGFGMKLPVKFNDFSFPPATLTTGGVAEIFILGGEDEATGAKYTMSCNRYVSGKPALAATLTEGKRVTHQKCNGYASSGGGMDRGRKTEGQLRAFILPRATCIAIVEYPVESRSKIQGLIPRFFNSVDLPGHGC